MKGLRVVPPLLCLTLGVHAASADTEFGDSVPREVVMQFIGGPVGGAGRLYSDVLDDFPPFAVPGDFTVLASADMGFQHRVILRTALDDEAALDAITGSFTDAGWVSIPEQGRGGGQQGGGFVSDAPVARYQQLCHDELGNLILSVSADGDARYVSINRNVTVQVRDMPDCAQQIQSANQIGFFAGGAMRGGRMLQQYVPRLVLPAAPAPEQQRLVSMVGGGGGSSNDWETSGRLAIGWSIDEIFEHFADQIADQDWEADSEVTGAQVASGSWTKSIDEMELIGMLNIVRTADETWDLKFRILRVDSQ